MQSLEQNLKQLRKNFLKRRPPTASANDHEQEGFCVKIGFFFNELFKITG